MYRLILDSNQIMKLLSRTLQINNDYDENPTRQNGCDILNCGCVWKFKYANTTKNTLLHMCTLTVTHWQMFFIDNF